MTCERFEELLSAYLEGGLAAADKAEAESHIAACRECAALAALMKETMAAAAAFPQAEPSPGLLEKLYAIPAKKRERKRLFGLRLRPVFDFLTRPALQPVYAAFTVLLIALTFVLFHPQARGIRKAIDVQFHKGVGTVEKLYAGAGSLKGEIGAFSANVLRSLKTLDLFKGSEGKQ